MSDESTTGSTATDRAYQEILYSVADKVATITLNTPERRNALSFRMRREIVSAVRIAERDDDVSIVLINANGPAFCAGYDLKPSVPEANDATAGHYLPSGGKSEGWVDSEEFNGWTDQWARGCLQDWWNLWSCLKPVVAMVHSTCLAGGTELMSMCDIVFVADDARIGYPPMRGMSTPDVPYFPWKVSMAQAKYLQITGNSVTGKEAAEMGWVVKSFPADELAERTARELRAITTIPVALLSANKQQVNQAYEIQGMRTHLDQAWSFHQLSGAYRPDAGRFGEIMRADGMKAALQWRDGGFQEQGFV